MTVTAIRMRCRGCGATPASDDPFPFRCPNAGSGDVDHVLARQIDPARLEYPAGAAETQPFARYRRLLYSYQRGRAGGLSDGQFNDIVHRLDESVRGVDGRGFTATPFARDTTISDRLGFSATGGVWVKDETGNVAGSHKGRHLFGVLLQILVAEALGLSVPQQRPDLAIASCGNAALAAAVIARAGDLQLRVFVPVDADSGTLARLRDLGAETVACPRPPGHLGDPTYARLREAVAAGALPFTCQGNENGLAIEGGQTLGYEIVSAMEPAAAALDDLVIQVGGGALASACIASFDDAIALRALGRGPRVHTVQTAGAHPLERAYQLVINDLPDARTIEAVEAELHVAATHRSHYMWPWETEPRSIATGILDDETYDWLAVVGGMVRSGGQPVVASEERLAQANALGREAGYDVDATGTAGLAGLLELRAAGRIDRDASVGVLFTGVQRVASSSRPPDARSHRQQLGEEREGEGLTQERDPR